jgi:hypothetical protein
MPIETDKPEKDPLEVIERKIKWLFASYIQRDTPDELKDIAEYFLFLAEKVNPRALSIDAPQNIINPFESVYLLLQDKLNAYPESIRHQVKEITEKNHICDIMAVAGSIDSKDIARIKFRNVFQTAMGLMPIIGGSLKVSIANEEYVNIDNKQLFKIKVSLNRLSNILNYASSIELVDYDQSFHKVKENYDPDLIDKSKLLAFINILRVQVNNHPESKEKNTILERLENIETELRRPKARWGIVITGFFVLLGFVADIKTIKPDIYNEPYAILQRVIATIHEDGIVRGKPPQLLEHHNENSESAPHIEEPRTGLPPKREDVFE